MTTTELLALFRIEVFDATAPYFWSDSWIYGAIDDAQKQFCRDTEGIEDARSFKLNILANGTQWYAVDPKILKLRDAIDPATGHEVPIIAIEKMRDHGLIFDNSSGPLKALISGMEKNTLRALPNPNVASTVELRTFRLPEDVVAGDDLEIDGQHHRHLLNWVKHLAYNIQDAETFDKAASDKYETRHHAYCAKAKAEQSRARRPVGTVTYGGL